MFNAKAYIPRDIESQAVDAAKLSTNFYDIIADCNGIEDFEPRNFLQDRYPLVAWLLDTSFARYLRARSTNAENFVRSDEDMVIRDMKIPGTVWTLEPANDEAECCWTMPDFAKCSSEVPLYGVCLKDCDNIYEDLFYRRLRIQSNQTLDGIARQGEDLKAVNERLMRLWMAFYTAHTAVLGTSDTSDNITKNFHGLVEVLENPAVLKLYGANILGAFESLGCRIDVLDGNGDYVLVTNPLIYNALKAVIVKGRDGEYPAGWERNGEEIRFHGIRFIRDKIVPVDMTTQTGEIWLLNGDSVGLFLATTIMPETDFIIRDDFTEQKREDGCGRLCTYMYNFGAVANNNAQRLAVITDVPVNGACAVSIGDLGGLINPNTLIPA